MSEKRKVNVKRQEKKRIEELNQLVKISENPEEIKLYERELRSIAAKAIEREKLNSKGENNMKDQRFEKIYTQGKLEQYNIIRDNETGVLYMMNTIDTGVGLTVMVDQEGKPLIDENYKTSG